MINDSPTIRCSLLVRILALSTTQHPALTSYIFLSVPISCSKMMGHYLDPVWPEWIGSIGPPPLCYFNSRRFRCCRRPASPGPFTRELVTHLQALSDLSSRRAALPLVPATDACHSTWRRCHSPPTHSCTMRVPKTSTTIHRSFISGYRALDFSDAE